MANSNFGANGETLPLDALLRALETLPGIDDAAWDLTCLRTAVRIARATGTPGSVERVSLAYRALSPASRDRLIGHITRLARGAAGSRPSASQSSTGWPSVLGTLVSSLVGGRGADKASGVIARDRIRRDMVSGRR